MISMCVDPVEKKTHLKMFMVGRIYIQICDYFNLNCLGQWVTFKGF